MLNYTCLFHIIHMWNAYPSFFNLLWVPYKDKVKIRGHMILHRTPLSPKLMDMHLNTELSLRTVLPLIGFNIMIDSSNF